MDYINIGIDWCWMDDDISLINPSLAIISETKSLSFDLIKYR